MNSTAVNDALEAAALALRDLATRNRDLMTRCSQYENTIRMVLRDLQDAGAWLALTDLLEQQAANADEPGGGIFTEGE